jgi:hypothetical protein
MWAVSCMAVSGGEHVLLHMPGGQVMALAQLLPGLDQGRVVFQARQLLLGAQQPSPQMAFARAPVQPVGGLLRKAQALGEGFDLLPFAPRYVHLQARVGGCKGVSGQALDPAQGEGGRRQFRERRRGGQVLGMVVAGFGVLQRTLAQPLRQFGVLRFPRQVQVSEGPWAPEVLVVVQKPVQRLEAGQQVSGPGRHRRATSAPAV